MQVQLENIPQYLKTNGQFCNWQYELRDGNQTQVPYMPGTTRRASVNAPSTFKPFDVAVAAKSYDGIGIRVCGKIVGIDIDDCEKIHRAVDPILDEKDPIAESYHF